MAVANCSFSGESINSVSVAVDSASSDVGVEADLEGFGCYRHNPYGSLSDMAAIYAVASPTSSTSAPRIGPTHTSTLHPPIAVGTSPVANGTMAHFPTTPPPAYENGNPYMSQEQGARQAAYVTQGNTSMSNLQAMRGHFDNAAKKKRDRRRPMRFMPPPPPSLQGARVMEVCGKGGLEYYHSANDKAIENIALVSGQSMIHGPKTCVAAGDFAFLTKAPGTSNWASGYGAYYSATEWEGAPAATFHCFNQEGEGFQKYVKVLMKWYSRVSRQYDQNSPLIAENFEQLASTTNSLPKKFFSHSSVPPCPKPEFEISTKKGLEYIGNVDQFIVWHDDIQEWWARFVQPKMIGFLLHSRTRENDEVSDEDEY